MKHEKPPELDAFFAAGDSWAHDRAQGSRRSQRIAWIVAGIATAIAICEAIALMALAPLKTVQPYTLMVDRQTGFVQALDPLRAPRISGDSALTQSFLVQYVTAREGFDIDALQTDYRKIALWSAGQARADYLTRMQASNAASPLARYARSTRVDVEVKSVTPMSDSTAMVRFDTIRTDLGGSAQPPQSWVALARYSFDTGPMSAADRFINPLGFKVQGYRRSAEVLPSAAPQAPIGGQPRPSAQAVGGGMTRIDAVNPSQPPRRFPQL